MDRFEGETRRRFDKQDDDIAAISHKVDQVVLGVARLELKLELAADTQTVQTGAQREWRIAMFSGAVLILAALLGLIAFFVS
jgi:hypothetical protein